VLLLFHTMWNNLELFFTSWDYESGGHWTSSCRLFMYVSLLALPIKLCTLFGLGNSHLPLARSIPLNLKDKDLLYTLYQIKMKMISECTLLWICGFPFLGAYIALNCYQSFSQQMYVEPTILERSYVVGAVVFLLGLIHSRSSFCIFPTTIQRLIGKRQNTGQ
jgi:hypothetical protein